MEKGVDSDGRDLTRDGLARIEGSGRLIRKEIPSNGRPPKLAC